MNFPDHAAVNARTGFLLKKVSTASFMTFAEAVAPYGLHPMHFGLLSILAAEEPVSQHELAARAGIDPSTMVARMDVLEEKGLVERTRSSGDRRSYEIRMTPAGRRTYKKVSAAAQKHGDQFFSALSERERVQLHKLLEKLAAGL